jgi:signal transduction histidine kinase
MLFDQMPMGVVVFDRSYRVVRFNPTWSEHIRRYTMAQSIEVGKGFFELIPDVRPTLQPLFEQVLRGVPFRQDSVKLTANGIDSWWNLALEPIPNGGLPSGILGVSTDVTAQIRIKAELERTLDELRQAHGRTEQHVADRTRELMTLINVQQALASRLNAQDVLQLIADESLRLTHTDISALFMPDEDGLALSVLSATYPVDIQPGYRMSLTESVTGRAFATGQVLRVDDSVMESHVDPVAMSKAFVRSILSIPLISDGRSIGVISVGNRMGKPLGEEEERLLRLMVPSAVIALENVRRYEQVREAAAADERGRLARDLHDAVTQTLFSASLTAEVLPKIWERDPHEGVKRLEKLRELTRGALAEMRTLLLELRPSALTEVPLCDLLRQLAEGIAGRTGIRIDVNVNGTRTLQSDVQIALYRIAQEALNNVAKHSGATHAAVDLCFDQQNIRMQIRDDGCGFDPAENAAHHLGLKIMTERAQAIGADLLVQTDLGRGTIIAVLWKEETFTDER